MTAINDLAEVAGSMRCAVSLVPLDLAMAGIGKPVRLLYESLPRSLIDLKSDTLQAINIAHASDRDIQVDQASPVDIYSLLEEVRRTLSGMQERSASIPDIYAHYAYTAALAPQLAASNMPEPDIPVESRPASVDAIKREPSRTPSADVKPKSRQKVVEKESQPGDTPGYAFEQDIGHSNLIMQQLRDDSAVLSWNMAEIERMVDEAIRLSSGGSIGNVSNAAYTELYRAVSADAEKSRETRPEAGMPQAPDMAAGVRKYPAITDGGKEAPASTPVARSLAEGAGLLNMIRRSTPDIIVLQAAMARDVSGSMAMEAIQPSAEPGFTEVRFVPSEASGAGNAGSSADEPDLVAPRAAAKVSPVSSAMDVTKIFNGLVRSYLVARGTAPGRHATKEGITQLLLSLPGPQTPESPVPELFSVAARLQDARPTVTEAPIAEDTSSLLGDLRELRGTMATLQAAVGSLRLPVVADTTGSQETTGTMEMPAGLGLTDNDIIAGNIPAAGQPDQEWISGELLSVQGSIARLQAAFNYLRVNVPTLADFVVLQKFIQVAPTEQATTVTQALPAGIAIEGVQPKRAPIPLPDYTWVTREFLQMQGMVARLQVPMYAEGGLVEQPTLAFVGESEPEWIVPMSAWDASQSKLNEFYSILWSQIQDLGTAMQDTVKGVNEALGSAQTSSGSGTSSGEGEDSGDAKEYNVDYMDQMNDAIGRLLDPYLKQFNLSISDMKGSFTSMSKAGFITAGSGIATLYGTDKLKEHFLGDEEEEDASGDGGGDTEAEGSDDSDEEDFWSMIEGMGAAASISDKRNGNFGDSDD
jgi:hypothetical protein